MTSELTITVQRGADLEPQRLREVLRLFDETYDQADHDYLTTSFQTLPWISIATGATGVVGFAVGDSRTVPLPRMSGTQSVALAGISCISPSARRSGLFSELAFASMAVGGAIEPDRPLLFCGRMAHAVSYRVMAKNASGITPSANETVSEWRREVLDAVADLYSVSLKPGSSVVVGKGKPIGYPRLDYAATKDEERLFAEVDRGRGDSLLAISWIPAAPEGW